MTNKEAIEILPVAKLVLTESPNIVGAEFKRYSEAIDISIEALEKRIHKKPKVVGFNEISRTLVYGCPNCNENWDENLFEPDFCWECGQAIDWSE